MAEDKINESSLWEKITTYAKQAGIKVIYAVLLMFYAYRRKDTPKWAKRIIIGALGYFIAPIDAIPDLAPLIGYTDDFGVLGLGLVAIAAYINDEVRQQSKEKLNQWFGEYDETELDAVDKKL